MYNNHVCNTKRAILRSFIFQLCNWDKSLAAVAIEDYELKSPYGSRIRSHTISDDELLEKLIHLMGGEPCYVLLDGLDECEEKERGILLTALIKLTKDCHSLRLLVASRKETDLQEQLPRVSTEIPVDIHNGGDIKIYTSQRLEVLGKRIYNSVFSGDTTKELMIIAARKIVSESHGQ
jgi:hypothetical protein